MTLEHFGGLLLNRLLAPDISPALYRELLHWTAEQLGPAIFTRAAEIGQELLEEATAHGQQRQAR